MGRWVYDLASDDLIIEVVCTPLNEARGMELREKLSMDDRTKYAIYYTNRKRDLSYLRRSVKGHLRRLDVRIYSLLDLVSIFRGRGTGASLPRASSLTPSSSSIARPPGPSRTPPDISPLLPLPAAPSVWRIC